MIYELIIIGAGPAGIAMATEMIAQGVHPSNVLIIEKGEQHSMAIRKFYPESKPVLANYKGQDPISRGVMKLSDCSKEETLQYFDQVINYYEIKIQYSTNVSEISKEKGVFTVKTDKGSFWSKNTSIAIGMMGRPNKPTFKIPSNIRSQCHYNISSKSIKNNKVLIVGGGDSAGEYAHKLADDQCEVVMSYRNDNFFRMSSVNRGLTLDYSNENKMEVKLSTNIESVSKFENKIRVVFKEDISDIIVDHIVFALGGTTPTEFLSNANIRFDDENNPILSEHNETTISGLYLIGDLSVGKKGGSIISAYNSAYTATKHIMADEEMDNQALLFPFEITAFNSVA